MKKTAVYILPDYVRINGQTGELMEKEAMIEKKLSISLMSAKNQAVSFQIAVVPEDGTLSELSVETKYENVEVFIEWFHHLRDMLIPDMLIPYNEGGPAFKIPMDEKYMPDQKAGAMWVDVWIPEDTETGLVEKELVVTAGGERYVIKAEIIVRDLVVPSESRITADLNNYADSISHMFDSLKNHPERYDDGSYLAVEKEFYRMSRDHKCLYHNLPYKHSGAIRKSFAPELTGEGKNIRVKSWESFDKHFGPYLDGSAFEGCRFGSHPLEFMYLPFHLGWPANYEKWGKKGYKTENRRILQEFIRHFEEKGWDSTYCEILLNHKKDYRFFPYTVDEIWYEHDQDVVDTYYDVIKDIYETSPAKFVFRMDSSNHYGNHFDHRFSDYCKMWVAGFGMFNWFPESVQVMNDKGNILWVYGGVLGTIDERLTNLFIWPIQCMMTGATGFTAWCTTGFGPDPLDCGNNGGSELLFYPGSYFGIEAPLPSLRLKVLRNALQIADLVMTYRATNLQGKLEACINESFGLKSNSDWFCDKPDFVDTPPRYWDFGGNFGKYCLPPMYEGRPVSFNEQIVNKLYDIMDGGPASKSVGVVFKYQ